MSKVLSRRFSRLGFTLLEMLVATAILCVLVVMLYNIIGSTTNVVGQSRRFFDLHSKARAALDQLTRDLNQGVYRPDVLSFVDPNAVPILAFFSRRSGAFGSGMDSTNYRQLIYVYYEAGTDPTNGSMLTLRRGTVSPAWSDSSTYPATSLNGALPFASNAVDAGLPAATNATNLARILDGVARLEVRFLGSDGVYRKAYYSSTNTSTGTNTNAATSFNATNNTNALTKAVAVTVLVVDEMTQNMFSNNPAMLATFQQNFLGTNQKLKTPDETNASLAAVWDKALNDPNTWDGIPVKARNGIYCFERIVPLR